MESYYRGVDLDLLFVERPDGLLDALKGRFSTIHGEAFFYMDHWVLCLQPLSYDGSSTEPNRTPGECVQELATALEQVEGSGSALLSKRVGMIFDFGFDLKGPQRDYFKFDFEARAIVRLVSLNASIRVTVYSDYEKEGGIEHNKRKSWISDRCQDLLRWALRK